MSSAKELRKAALEIAKWLEWDSASLDDCHRYAQQFRAPIGGNVYEIVLTDALRLHGLTLEQFRAQDVAALHGEEKP